MTRLQDRIAVITGAASGMGAAAAERLAAEGAHVVVADRDETAAKSVAAGIGERGGSAHAYAVDATDAAEVEALFAAVERDHGRLHVLHAHVGVPGPAGLDVSDADWDRTVDLNMRSAFLAARAALPLMGTSGGGSIVFTASTSAIIGSPFSPLYSMTKGALTSFTRSLALLGGKDQIRVNVICPGAVDTPMLPQFVGRSGETEEEIAARKAALAARVPLGRISQPAEIASVVAFLASDDASYVTGAVIPVDGGRTAG